MTGGFLMTYWSAWVVGLLLILVLPTLAVVAQIGIRRTWPSLASGEHNDVAGFIIAVVGVIYAVLLAFVVIVSWEKFVSAEAVVGEEASALRSIYRESTAFPLELREQLNDDVRRYATRRDRAGVASDGRRACRRPRGAGARRDDGAPGLAARDDADAAGVRRRRG
jgi:hypothetical protein